MKQKLFHALNRNTFLFLGGLIGVGHETLLQHAERPTLLILFAAMMGLPAFLSSATGHAMENVMVGDGSKEKAETKRVLDSLLTPGKLQVLLSRRLMILDCTDEWLKEWMKDESVIGKWLFSVFPEISQTGDSLTNLRTELKKVFQTEKTSVTEPFRYDLERPNGSLETLWWETTISPIFDPHGSVVSVLLEVTNVTKAHKV